MTAPSSATANVDSLLNQIKSNLGLPISAPRPGNEQSVIIDAAPFVAPFSKAERIYRMADWTASGQSASAPNQSRVRGSTAGLTGIEGDEDWTLSLAEPTKLPTANRKILGPRAARGVLPPRSGISAPRTGGQNRGVNTKGSHATSAKSLGWGQRAYDRQKTRETSVKIDPTWTIMEEVEFSRISKLQYDPETPELLASGGSVNFYNKALDRLTTKSAKNVDIDESNQTAYLPLSSDPVIAKLATEIDGTVVFMSDAAAALLMATPRTVNPWDLVTKRLSPTAVIVDQRDGAQLSSSFSLEQILVSETANEPPVDERDAFNSAHNLTIEATRINQIIPSIICSSESKFNVGSDCLAPNGLAYKYFKWSMGEGKNLVIRSLVNAANRIGSNDDIILVRSLLEFDSSRSSGNLDWRSKLDNQRGAILANEIKNNNAIIARWVFQAYLAQVDNIKLAYVSRVSPKDRARHELLALQDIEPYELATQMNLDTANGFGILRALFDLFIKSEESVIIVRDPIKPMLRLYAA